MARTIQQIKTELTTAFMANETLQEKYGFATDATFEQTFSKVSIEGILLFIVAAAIWTLEKLFDTHATEIDELIVKQKPHTLQWYANKVKQFRYGQALIAGTDEYDDTGLTEADIEQRQIVKFSAVNEEITETRAIVYIKVATEADGAKTPLSEEQLAVLEAYLAEVKDAGIKVVLINKTANRFKLDLVVYYDPMVLNANGETLTDGSKPVHKAIEQYINNLPFNGEYSNMALTDALQVVPGVKIPEIKASYESVDDEWQPIDVKATPSSGYYAYDENEITITFRVYEKNF